MAPTICAEKESATRDRFRKNRIRQQHNNSNHHHYRHQLNGVLNGGKITHRRSISSRNALSKLTSLRIPDSESSNDTDSQSVRSIDDEITNKINENSLRTMMQIDDRDSSLLSERLSISKETFSVFRNVKHHNYLHNHRNNELITTTAALQPNSSFIGIHDDSTSFSTSTLSSATSLSALDLDQVIATVSKFPQRRGGSTRKLIEIAVKTIKLIKRNQLLQKKLAQLQFETRVFIESVMANPENQALRHKMEISNKKVET